MTKTAGVPALTSVEMTLTGDSRKGWGNVSPSFLYLPTMTFEIVFVLGVLVVAVALFVTERLRVDVVAMLVLLSLMLADVLGFEEAVAGFSNEAVITIASVLVLSGALARTGVANIIGDRVLGLAGGSRTGLLVTMMATVGLLSGFMNDIGVTALLLPVVVDLARRTDQPPSKLLIPLAFASLLGGMTTLIGTAPNILISGALHEAGLEPFSLFDFSLIGYAALAAGILYMVTLGRRLLPTRRGAESDQSISPDRLGGLYGLAGVLFAVTIPKGSWLVGRSLAEIRPGSALGITVLAVRREGKRHLDLDGAFRVAGGDRLLLSGRDELLRALQTWDRLEVTPASTTLRELVPAGVVFTEISVPAGLAGARLADWDLRRRFAVAVLGVHHSGRVQLTHLSGLELDENDRLLLMGREEDIERLESKMASAASRRQLGGGEMEVEYGLTRRLVEVTIPADSELDSITLADSHLGESFGFNVVAIRRGDTHQWLPGPGDLLHAGDVLLVEGRNSDFALLEAFQELEPMPPQSTVESLSTEQHGFAEFILEPRSTMIGSSLSDILFRQRFGLNVLAMWKGARAFRTGLADRALELGDAFLVHGPRDRIEGLAADPNFICLTRADATPVRRQMAPVAAAIMGGVLALVITGVLPIYIAAPAGALAMVISRCVSMEEAYSLISWRAVLLIAGMLSLGRAMEESGAAELIATGVLGSVASFGTPAVVGALFLVTALSAQVMPTAAVAVLMAPIGLSTAANLGLSPHAVLMAVAIGSSCAFLSPVGHPVNLLVMGVGGYRFTDYARVGLPLLVIVFLVVVLLLPLVWPLG